MLIGFIKISENYIIDGLTTGVMVQRHLMMMNVMQTSYIFNKNDASNKLGVQIYNTEYAVGGIPRRSKFPPNTTIQSIIIKMLGDSGQLPVDTSTPNTRYKSQNLGIWYNTTDVNNFLYNCCHDTGYYGATIGSYVTIKDGVYNKQWVIAGFDMEYNHQASNGTIKDNGYGICLIPKNSLGTCIWTNIANTQGYNNSTINISTLPTVANNLKKVLGDHLIKRNVLLGNSVDSNHYTDGYAWTTAYCTLMSAGQITGTFKCNRNIYDDGEANYKLPLFNYETWRFDGNSWLRGAVGSANTVYSISASGEIVTSNCKNNACLRPLIYIR